MDVMSLVNSASAMQNAVIQTEMSVAVAKKGQDVQKMLGEGAIELIKSAGADVAAHAQGKGFLVNMTA